METDEKPPRRSTRSLQIALALSLALNLLVIGFFAGSLARQSGSDGGRTPALGNFGMPYVMALTREDRRAVQRALRAGDALPDRKARRAMFRGVIAYLRAEPFDAEALEAAVQEQAGVSVSVQHRLQEAWLETVSAMSEEQRRAYAVRVEAILDRRTR